MRSPHARTWSRTYRAAPPRTAQRRRLGARRPSVSGRERPGGRSALAARLVREPADPRRSEPKVVQMLARHCDPRLTLGVYSKLRPDEERRALGGVPSIAPQAAETVEETGQRRTGTKDGAVLAPRLAQGPAVSCSDPTEQTARPASGTGLWARKCARPRVRIPQPPPSMPPQGGQCVRSMGPAPASLASGTGTARRGSRRLGPFPNSG